MADIKTTITHNVVGTTSNTKQSGGSNTVEFSATDRTINKQIASGIKELMTVVSKQASDNANNVIIKLLTDLLKSTSNSKIDEATIKRIVGAFVSKTTGVTSKQTGGSTAAPRPAAGRPYTNPENLINNIIKKFEGSLSSLFTTLERQGLVIDPTSRKQLVRELEGAIGKALPDKSMSILKELNNTLKALVVVSKTDISA